jgi:hypothetical protein
MCLLKELVALSRGGRGQRPYPNVQKIKVEIDRGKALISVALLFIQKV